MCSEEEFSISGPRHMMVDIGGASSPTKMIDIDWGNEEHRRCTTACLVKGTYVMESDRTKSRTGTAALAPAWWKSFHFRLIDEYEFPCNMFGTWFIHGAAFKYECPHGELHRHPSAPRYIVAFRGTMLQDPTFLRDMHQNLHIVLNKQHCGSRFRDARERVRRLILDSVSNGGAAGGSDIWLAGHSLGASIALDVGRGMMREWGCNLPTFLFNPPHVSLVPVINVMRVPEQAKRVLYITSFMVKAALANTVAGAHDKGMEELFKRLAPWVPELYVHERDCICHGFIDYFEQRQMMLEQWGLQPVAEVAMRISFRDMWKSKLSANNSENNGDDELRVLPHLLPSARLWKNSSEHYSHELEQWWQPDNRLNLSSRQYAPDAGVEQEQPSCLSGHEPNMPYIYHGP